MRAIIGRFVLGRFGHTPVFVFRLAPSGAGHNFLSSCDGANKIRAFFTSNRRGDKLERLAWHLPFYRLSSQEEAKEEQNYDSESISSRSQQERQRGRVALWVAGVLLLSLGLFVNLAVPAWSQHNAFTAEANGSDNTATNTTRTPTNATSLNLTFAPLVKQALPAVVSISSSRLVKASDADEGLSPLFNDPRFRRYFGERPNGKVPDQRERGLGSGVIVSTDGYSLTNNHVVEGANDVKVYLPDKTELKARIIGTDPKTDIAVIKVDTKNLPVLPLGDSSQVQVGDLALAIGNPFGVGKIVTMGIVSATGRGNLGLEDYEDFIQTDAAINPGHSRGALIDTRGELIGINTAILSDGARSNQGVGFAVPVNMARRVMEQLLKNGKVARGYLGVMIQEVTPQLVQAFGLNNSNGALVGDVTADSPAAKVGLVKGDVITQLNDEGFTDSRELRLKISQLAPGATVKLKVLREGQERELGLTLGELPNDNEVAKNWQPEADSFNGLSVEKLTPEIAGQLHVPLNTSGVVITNVAPNGNAADAGLRQGDVVQEVNRKPITNAMEFQAAMKQASGKPLLLLINRGGHTSYVVLDEK